MKNLLHIPILLLSCFATAQTGLYNSGNLQVYGNLGLHTNLINDGNFDQTQGLVGFYGNRVIEVSGSIPATLWDSEIMMGASLFLRNTLYVRNNHNFILGNIATPKNNQTIYLNFMDDGFYTGVGDASKINGFAAATNRDVISFPVGDQQQWRPLLLNSQSVSPLAICAYFFENPSNPTSITDTFDVDAKVQDIGTVSDKEYWIVQSDVPAQVTISWNPRSALGLIPNATPESIIIVGWSKASNQWVILGNSAFSGDINQGFVTSEVFVPSEFAAITFGTVPLPTDTFAVNNPSLGNYFLSPNGDGTNDALIIEGLEESPNNIVTIYNRLGQKVFEKTNYVDDFRGVSNTGSLILNQEKGLPEGVYYYIATLLDLELEYTGFLFLDR